MHISLIAAILAIAFAVGAGSATRPHGPTPPGSVWSNDMSGGGPPGAPHP
jgi:hypothetical protein